MVKWLNNQQGITEPINKNDFNIWVTYENRRPPHQNFDLTTSYDIDDYGYAIKQIVDNRFGVKDHPKQIKPKK